MESPVVDGHSAVEATLERIVADLGSGVVSVLAAPVGLEVAVSQAVIHDPAAPVDVERGDVVLAVGVGVDQAAAFLQEAARGGAAAVLLKLRAAPDRELVDRAEHEGLALLGVAPEITWAQLHALVRTSIISSGLAPEGGSGYGTPVGDLFSLANAVAAMVGGPTTIEDPQSRVLAYSSDDQPIDVGRRQTILGRQVPPYYVKRLHELGVFRRLWGSDEVVRIDDIRDPDGSARLRPRLAVAVRAGQEILGSIWVAEGDTPLGPEAEAALRQASQIAALHLVRNRSGEALERRMRGELLRSLLDGRGPTNVLADRLGLEPDASFVVLGFELQTSEEAEIALQRERALDLISLYCEAFRRRSAQVAVGRTVYTLLPIDDTARETAAIRLGRDVLERSDEALSVRLHVGVSSVVDHLRDVPRARDEVDQILRILVAKAQRFATFDDVRAHALLLELRTHVAAHPHLLAGRVDRLVAEDGDAGIYVDTLRAYLDAFGDVPKAARALDVHPNTFRYRLRRVVEIAGLDLDDPVERLAAELQLRLR
ncbi:MAG TPA: helix-turn-helix domain-containing protein [Egicoccus sp.]|nr:helix-turn-helix domain-containing protein [Egicoccus sp.]HSK24578.1 helix-turn-helix domain-containing protein [Egicoccus sp.]